MLIIIRDCSYMLISLSFKQPNFKENTIIIRLPVNKVDNSKNINFQEPLIFFYLLLLLRLNKPL